PAGVPRAVRHGEVRQGTSGAAAVSAGARARAAAGPRHGAAARARELRGRRARDGGRGRGGRRVGRGGLMFRFEDPWVLALLALLPLGWWLRGRLERMRTGTLRYSAVGEVLAAG